MNDDEEREFFADGRVPSPYWEPSFVVLLEDMGKLTFHGSEEVNLTLRLSFAGQFVVVPH